MEMVSETVVEETSVDVDTSTGADDEISDEVEAPVEVDKTVDDEDGMLEHLVKQPIS